MSSVKKWKSYGKSAGICQTCGILCQSVGRYRRWAKPYTGQCRFCVCVFSATAELVTSWNTSDQPSTGEHLNRSPSIVYNAWLSLWHTEQLQRSLRAKTQDFEHSRNTIYFCPLWPDMNNWKAGANQITPNPSHKRSKSKKNRNDHQITNEAKSQTLLFISMVVNQRKHHCSSKPSFKIYQLAAAADGVCECRARSCLLSTFWAAPQTQ